MILRLFFVNYLQPQIEILMHFEQNQYCTLTHKHTARRICYFPFLTHIPDQFCKAIKLL